MTNAYFDELSKYRDIESLQFYDEYTKAGCIDPDTMMKALQLRSRDNARTPMQWNDKHNAGFSENTPWIDINPNYKYINAENQISNENSVLTYYKKLIQLRKENEIVVYGNYKVYDRDNDKIFAYERELNGEKLLTVCNFTDKEVFFTVPNEYVNDSVECWISNINRTQFTETMKLQPYEAFVLAKKGDYKS